MITRMSNGWYLFDEHEVPRIIDALLVAGYQRLPHWFFVHGHNHITLQYSRRGISILAPPDVWEAYADLLNLGDGEVIAGRLDRLGWRRRPSYGFTGPSAAVYIMSSAVTGSELWLNIRGPKPYRVRAALDPLGVERLADDAPPHAPTTHRTGAPMYLLTTIAGSAPARYNPQCRPLCFLTSLVILRPMSLLICHRATRIGSRRGDEVSKSYTRPRICGGRQTQPPTTTPPKAGTATLKERSAAQEHFIDLCRLVGHPTPAESDPTGTQFTFEAGADRQRGGTGWADVWKRGFFAMEYTGKHADLDKAYQQLLQYRESLENPPLLIASDIDSIALHTNFTNTVKQVHRLTLDDLLTPVGLQRLRDVFYQPEAFRVPRTTEQVTLDAGREFAKLAALEAQFLH